MNPLLTLCWALALLWGLGGAQVAFAHGDEPHGDEPHPVAAATDASPNRFESSTDVFELAGQLEAGRLVLFLQRFATSEPVRGARIELESGALKAQASEQQDRYVVQDAAFVQALTQTGTHALVLTVTAGDEADLLEAHFNVPPVSAARAPHSTEPPGFGLPGWPWLMGMAGVAAAALGVWLWRRRQNPVEVL